MTEATLIFLSPLRPTFSSAERISGWKIIIIARAPNSRNDLIMKFVAVSLNIPERKNRIRIRKMPLNRKAALVSEKNFTMT